MDETMEDHYYEYMKKEEEKSKFYKMINKDMKMNNLLKEVLHKNDCVNIDHLIYFLREDYDNLDECNRYDIALVIDYFRNGENYG